MGAGNLHLILLAGGQGLRAAGSDGVPKQFRPIGGGLMFTFSLRDFLTLESGSDFRPSDLVLTVPDTWRETAGEALRDLDIPWSLAQAGSSRTASTWNAARELEARYSPQADDLVAVHDAARPFASADLLVRLGAAAAESGGAVPGVPVPDTIVQSSEGSAVYLERSTLMGVQTPQVFRWDLFQAAHAWAAESGSDFTDDGGLLAERGHPPVVIPGEQGNWKVTTNGDWLRAETLLNSD
jgi:2-C-methyl-D-erythritol 4-phosphate cytidylyltransferase/2-C-methyl-D-erythritol 2,4-cyclodiphosphate synthase